MWLVRAFAQREHGPPSGLPRHHLDRIASEKPTYRYPLAHQQTATSRARNPGRTGKSRHQRHDNPRRGVGAPTQVGTNYGEIQTDVHQQRSAA
jgi:hypothetical protein